MANKHIVREREVAGSAESREVQGGSRGKVVSEIMGFIPKWRNRRDNDFEALWDEYYAKWRGFWMAEHKSFKTERSRLISPLTSMSIDLTSAEIIEAVLGREYWIDLPDNIGDKDTQDVDLARQMLTEDLRAEGFIDEFAKAVLNGCLYGNGIIKIQVNTRVLKRPVRTKNGELVVEQIKVPQLKPVAIQPGNFVGDPGVADIDDMTGCAHEFMLPLHIIRKRQAEGVYYKDVKIGEFRIKKLNQNRGDTEQGNRQPVENAAFVTEYYGLVSRRCFVEAEAEATGTTLADSVINAIPEHEMVECIATIANETHLLRIIETPLITGERLMVGYQHEIVPGRFYGRGVAEKGANIQRAMDAEMRGRIDALAWSNNPMFAFDLTRMPPGSNMNAWPGKAWGTRGNPNEVMREFKVSGPDQNSYAHMQELERMGQQATGALDTAGLRSGVRDETATGSALAASSFIKRSKRTMFNIEGMMDRMVRRTLRLKMQYESARYPQDYEFRVRGTLGMMAREIEQNFMVGLLSVIGPDSPASMPVIRAIFEHSGSPVKSEVLAALKAIDEKQPSEEEKAAEAAQLAMPVKQVELIDAQIAKTIGEAGLKDAQTDKTEAEAAIIPTEQGLKQAKVMIDIEQIESTERSLDIQEDDNEIKRDALRLQEKALSQKKPAS